jgi:DNA polymerase epsilon subunit 1
MSKRGGGGGGRNPIFGLTGSMGKRGGRGGSNTRFTGRKGGYKRTGGNANEGNSGDVVLDRTDDGTAAQERYEEVAAMDEVDEKLGFWRFDSAKADGEEKIGWLVNMHQVSLLRVVGN